jgi:hypothetical protein
VRIAAITGYALLELVRGEVINELSEHSLAGIHPSLSAIAISAGCDQFASSSAGKCSNRKIRSSPEPIDSALVIDQGEILAGQQCSEFLTLEETKSDAVQGI